QPWAGQTAQVAAWLRRGILEGDEDGFADLVLADRAEVLPDLLARPQKRVDEVADDRNGDHGGGQPHEEDAEAAKQLAPRDLLIRVHGASPGSSRRARARKGRRRRRSGPGWRLARRRTGSRRAPPPPARS